MKVSLKTLLSVAIACGSLGMICMDAHAAYRGGEFKENHPRRAEVLQRDRHLSHNLKQDKGQLGGNYNQLMRQDKAIHRQERWEARANGGHITRGEQRQLNHEENHLRREIRHDHNKG